MGGEIGAGLAPVVGQHLHQKLSAPGRIADRKEGHAVLRGKKRASGKEMANGDVDQRDQAREQGIQDKRDRMAKGYGKAGLDQGAGFRAFGNGQRDVGEIADGKHSQKPAFALQPFEARSEDGGAGGGELLRPDALAGVDWKLASKVGWSSSGQSVGRDPAGMVGLRNTVSEAVQPLEWKIEAGLG
jgi:hypothetical protein